MEKQDDVGIGKDDVYGKDDDVSTGNRMMSVQETG